jgi:peroxin-14
LRRNIASREKCLICCQRHTDAIPAMTFSGYEPSHPSYHISHLSIAYIPRCSTMSSPSSRQDLIQNAVLFLQDPKTQSSPLTSKIEFLQAKGLNEQEIQEALSRSSSGPSTSSSSSGQYRREESYGYGAGVGTGIRYEMAPVPPKRDWRDLFVCPIIFLLSSLSGIVR